MIICPTCREEIDDDSRYCDQCGQALLFCQQCGRVGVGRRCTHCGGLMVDHGGKSRDSITSSGSSITGYASYHSIADGVSQPGSMSMPVMTLSNDSLNIRIQAYVSGVHAQLKFNPHVGWCVTDKHSSNGTKLNQRPVQPDVEMTLKNGDILTLANVSLQVNIR